jgi:hypothetical protein
MANRDYDALSWDEIDSLRPSTPALANYESPDLSKMVSDRQPKKDVAPITAHEIMGELHARLEEGRIPSDRYFRETSSKDESYRARGLAEALSRTISQLAMCTGLA